MTVTINCTRDPCRPINYSLMITVFLYMENH